VLVLVGSHARRLMLYGRYRSCRHVCTERRPPFASIRVRNRLTVNSMRNLPTTVASGNLSSNVLQSIAPIIPQYSSSQSVHTLIRLHTANRKTGILEYLWDAAE
jgi:hypothetical protein